MKLRVKEGCMLSWGAPAPAATTTPEFMGVNVELAGVAAYTG
jgi:hypothetical protein